MKTTCANEQGRNPPKVLRDTIGEREIADKNLSIVSLTRSNPRLEKATQFVAPSAAYASNDGRNQKAFPCSDHATINKIPMKTLKLFVAGALLAVGYVIALHYVVTYFETL
jgi:hypothetical protein